MTDARFPERWLNDRRVLRLPDDAFRLFVCGLVWSVANKTDGWLSDEDLQLIPGVNLKAAAALQDAELWGSHLHGWQITEFEEIQTTRADLEALARGRRAQRDKKRRQRARAALAAAAVPGDVPGDTPRTGQDRTGQAPRNVVPGNGLTADARFIAPDVAKQGRETAPPQTRKRVHDGPEHGGPDAQHFPIEVHAGAQPQTVTRAGRAP